ncbi:MAG: hypothetical protein ACRC8S_06170 [Fimbriiglobus sp.]
MRLLLALAIACLATDLRAGVYADVEPIPFTVNSTGALEELVYMPVFKSALNDRTDSLNPTFPLAVQGQPTYRGQVMARFEAARGGVAKAPLVNQLRFAHDGIRIGKTDESLNLLMPRTRDRSPDAVALLTLAHLHASRGEWSEARRVHDAAMLDADLPTTWPGAKPELTKRLSEIEKQYYSRWLRLHEQEASQRTGLEDQDIFPLFAGVKFVDEKGQYTPGQMAASEKAKLPADAIAIVQLHLLWWPADNRMLWLLGELYAAQGKLREAEQVFDTCTWGRSMSNRRVLMAHRNIVRDAVAKLPPEQEPNLAPDAEEPTQEQKDAARWAEFRPQLLTALGVLGTITLGMVALALRRILRG